jgi:hypothetical protein
MKPKSSRSFTKKYSFRHKTPKVNPLNRLRRTIRNTPIYKTNKTRKNGYGITRPGGLSRKQKFNMDVHKHRQKRLEEED